MSEEDLIGVIERFRYRDSGVRKCVYVDTRLGVIVKEDDLHDDYKRGSLSHVKFVVRVVKCIKIDNDFHMGVMVLGGAIEECVARFFEHDKSFMIKTHCPVVIVQYILNQPEFRNFFVYAEHPKFTELNYKPDYSRRVMDNNYIGYNNEPHETTRGLRRAVRRTHNIPEHKLFEDELNNNLSKTRSLQTHIISEYPNYHYEPSSDDEPMDTWDRVNWDNTNSANCDSENDLIDDEYNIDEPIEHDSTAGDTTPTHTRSRTRGIFRKPRSSHMRDAHNNMKFDEIQKYIRDQHFKNQLRVTPQQVKTEWELLLESIEEFKIDYKIPEIPSRPDNLVFVPLVIDVNAIRKNNDIHEVIVFKPSNIPMIKEDYDKIPSVQPTIAKQYMWVLQPVGNSTAIITNNICGEEKTKEEKNNDDAYRDLMASSESYDTVAKNTEPHNYTEYLDEDRSCDFR